MRRLLFILLLLYAQSAFAQHFNKHANTPPTISPASNLTYDTSIGTGVSNGLASLPLRVGAARFYVNSSTGSDSNSCTAAKSSTTPKATIASAFSCVTNNEGDQVVVAEGTSYTEPLPDIHTISGYSPAYPLVFQSYDPTDSTNEAKMGRATSGRPVINTGGTKNPPFSYCCATPPSQFIAIRGFKMGAPEGVDLQLNIGGAQGSANHYFLIENNVFANTMLGINESPGDPALHFVIRANSFYGSWASTSTTGGCTYLGGVGSLTVEDNIFYHCGWSVTLNNREANDNTVGGCTQSGGGGNVWRHAIYMQDTSNGIIRRNLMIDSCTTGLSGRGNMIAYGNVSINNPISYIAGLGNYYNYVRPNGESLFLVHNIALGDADINSSTPRGGGMYTGNGVPGSTGSYNLIVRSRAQTTNNYTFGTAASATQYSYMDWHDNVEYNWSPSGSDKNLDGSPNQALYGPYIVPSYENNAWSDPASGSNVNISSHAMPNPYPPAQLYQLLGFADKTAAVARWKDHPEDRPTTNISTLMFAGYGVASPATQDVAISVAKFINTAQAVSLILGPLDGSTLSATGLPSSVTLDSNNRTLNYDGTQTFGPTSITITESPVAGASHTTTLSIQAIASPTLTDISLGTTLVSGTPASGNLVGAYGGYNASYLVVGGAVPPGLTLDSATNGWDGLPSRTWNYNGTAFSHGSFTITEYLKGSTNNGHVSTISY